MAFGGGLDDAGDGVVSDINMTPLVDVMLVLLVIFILAVPVLTHSVKLELPRASTAPDVAAAPPVTVAVTEDGALYWDRDPVDEPELERRLRAVAAASPPREIQVRGDRAVPYERIVRVMAAAQRAGVTKLGFVTEPGAR